MDYSKTVFVSDMDGTLLCTDKTLNPADVAAVRHYTSLGGRFVLSTGRPLHTVTGYLSDLDAFGPMILCNGGVIYDYRKGKVLYEVDLPEIAKEIIFDIRSRYPDVSPEIYTFSSRYYFHLNTVEKWHQNLLGIEFNRVSDPEEIVEPWIKMLFADEIDVINDMQEYVKKFSGSGVRFVRSFPKFLEVLPDGVSKGSAVDKLVELCGLEDLTVCAAGDYDNDIEMLDRADISFCPSGSLDTVKEHSTYVLKNSCDSGAIAEALKILETL